MADIRDLFVTLLNGEREYHYPLLRRSLDRLANPEQVEPTGGSDDGLSVEERTFLDARPHARKEFDQALGKLREERSRAQKREETLAEVEQMIDDNEIARSLAARVVKNGRIGR